MRVFATLLYILLRNHIARLSLVIIDLEFPGDENERDIKDRVMTLLRRRGLIVYREQFDFQKIHQGKKEPPSHKLAWQVYKGLIKADVTVMAEDVLREF